MINVERKINPAGIDKIINSLQSHLADSLFVGNPTLNWIMYPRVYSNPVKSRGGADSAKKSGGGFDSSRVPEHYQSDEYTEVFMDDSVDLSSYFLVGASRAMLNGIMRAKLSLICQVSNLGSIYPALLHRADEEFNSAFLDSFEDYFPNVVFTAITNEPDNVYKEFKGNYRLDDMNNFYVVRFDFDVFYNACCGC